MAINGKKVRSVDDLVLCNATVDLLSRVQRPFLWKVTVTGVAPYGHVRVYEFNAASDTIAAFLGIKQFEKDMLHPLHILQGL